MEYNYEMRESEKVRFRIFIVIHIVLCMFVFFYTKGLEDLLPSGSPGPDDGFAALLYFILSPFIALFATIIDALDVVALVVWSAVLLIPLGSIAVKKATRVTEYEVTATLKVIVWGIVLTLAAGVLFVDMDVRWIWRLMSDMFRPVLIGEFTAYWIALYRKSQARDLQDISLEVAGQVVAEEYREDKPRMRALDKARFACFIVIHIVLCTLVFVYAKEVSDEYPDPFNALGDVVCAAEMAVGAAILLIPLRIIAVRKTTQITDFEVRGTFAVAAVGVVLTLAAGVIFIEFGILCFMVALSLPILILESTVYWSGLRDKRRV